jgi:hypothetical protein
MSRALVVLAAFAVVFNGPAGPFLVQTAAWAAMLGKTYSRTGSVRLAVSETFDGEHPCCLCRKAQAMAEELQRQQAPPGKPPLSGKELVLLLRPEECGSVFVVRKATWIATLREEAGLSSGRGREDVEDPPPEQEIRC